MKVRVINSIWHKGEEVVAGTVIELDDKEAKRCIELGAVEEASGSNKSAEAPKGDDKPKGDRKPKE